MVKEGTAGERPQWPARPGRKRRKPEAFPVCPLKWPETHWLFDNFMKAPSWEASLNGAVGAPPMCNCSILHWFWSDLQGHTGETSYTRGPKRH